MIGSLIAEVIHPFGRGALTSTGAQYSATVSTAGSTSFIEVESASLQLPANAMIAEVEFGLTIGLSLTATTDSPKVTYNIKDSGQTSYDSLYAVASTVLAGLVSTTILVDYTGGGRKTPSSGTYFTGKGSFDVQATIASNASTSNARGGMKNSSYLLYSYYLIK